MQDMKLSQNLTTISFTITKWFNILIAVIWTQNFRGMNYLTLVSLSTSLEIASLPHWYYCY
jgi:hypothetical protein